MKRILLVLLTMLLALVLNCAVAEEDDTAVYTSGDYKYILLEDGTAEIIDYMGNEEIVTIPGEMAGYRVTSIGAKAFFGCEALTSVVIPDSVSIIGIEAFAWCRALRSVTISDGVTTIGFRAFLACSSLTEIELPENLMTIESEAFSGCNSLASICIPRSISRVGSRAFEFCNSLEVVSIPDSVAFDICLDDGGLRSVGPVPMAIVEEKLEQMCESLSRREKTEIEDQYKLYGKGKYGKKDNVEALEAAYPVLKEGVRLYILRNPNMKVHQRERLWKKLCYAGWTLEDTYEALSNLAEPQYSMVDYYSFVVTTDVFQTNSFPDGCTLCVEFDSLAHHWAVQNGLNITFAHGLPDWKTCEGYQYIVLPDGTAKIASYMGDTDGVLVIPATLDGIPVTVIGHMSFKCSAEALIVPEGIEKIEAGAFLEMYGAESVTLPTSLKWIEPYACHNMTCIVPVSSCAHQYCQDNGLPFVLAD